MKEAKGVGPREIPLCTSWTPGRHWSPIRCSRSDLWLTQDHRTGDGPLEGHLGQDHDVPAVAGPRVGLTWSVSWSEVQ
jgi:hypothetical protein